MKQSPLRSVLILLCCLLLLHPVQAQMSSKQIDQLVENALTRFNVAGAAVGIVKDGRIIHAKGYGVRSVENQTPVDAHTNFDIASNTKAFTTAALAMLVEEGRLSWQDKVVTHLPEFKMYDPWVTAHFTIVDLLTHRSGLGLGAGDLTIFPDGSDFTMQDIVSIFQHFQPVSEFRTKYDYDNLLYMVAGEVIKRVSGLSWEDFVQTRILDVIGMDRSFSTLIGHEASENLATPHFDDAGTLKPTAHDTFDPSRINGAAGAIVSNVDDLCQWMLLHLNHGKYGKAQSETLFSERSQKKMWRIHTVLNASRNPRYNAHFAGYGLGWRLTDVKGNLSVSHTGGLTGMLSKTLMIPDLNLGVVVLTNTWMGGASLFSAVSQTLVDSYLGLDDFDWVESLGQRSDRAEAGADSVVTAVWKTVKAAEDRPVEFGNFVGNYRDAWFGQITISIQDDRLWFASRRSPKLNGPMHFYKANTFAIQWVNREMDADAFASFTLDEEGRAQAIRMKGISPDIDFSYDFQDLDLRRVKTE